MSCKNPQTNLLIISTKSQLVQNKTIQIRFTNLLSNTREHDIIFEVIVTAINVECSRWPLARNLSGGETSAHGGYFGGYLLTFRLSGVIRFGIS